MVRLNDTYIGSKPYNAVDLIDKAYPRTWAYLSYASYTSYPLARHKREAPFILFDCFRVLEVLLLVRFKECDSWNIL